MLKLVDVYVLIGLLASPPGEAWTQAAFAANLGLPQPAVTRSLQRLARATLWDRSRRRVDFAGAEELLVHAVRFLAPARVGATARGVPTAHAAPPLSEAFLSAGAIVWPLDTGPATGPSLEPLHPAAPRAALADPRLYELLALVDALRVGRARERNLAAAALHERIHT